MEQKQNTENKENQYDNLLGAMAYVGPLFILTMVARPKSKFCLFHARQSVVLFAISIFTMFVLLVINFLGSILILPLFALYVISIYRAYMSEMWAIPIVSDFAKMIDVEKILGKAGASMNGISGMVESVAQQREDNGKEEVEEVDAAKPPEAK